MIDNKTILITGAAGSIGEILVKNFSKNANVTLILFDRNENDIYFLKEKNKRSKANLIYVLGDILDKEKLLYVFQTYHIDYVIHCAAYKQIPLMELNLYEAIRNNIEGLLNIVEMSIRFKVAKFLFISSDKAVYPTSIMGLTKRAGELVVAKENQIIRTIQFLSLRFSNLLNSNGSILPLFERQLKLNNKISVTDKNASRFFINKDELSSIVIEALKYKGIRSILTGDYKNEININDLAKSFLLEKGYKNIEEHIDYVGLREGEKLKEDLKYSFEKKIKLKENLLYEIDSDIIVHKSYMESIRNLVICNSPDKEDVTMKLFLRIMKKYIV